MDTRIYIFESLKVPLLMLEISWVGDHLKLLWDTWQW